MKLHRNLYSLSFSLSSPNLPPPALSSTEIKAVLNVIPSHCGLAELTLRIQGHDKFNLWIPPAESASCFCTAVVKTYPGTQRVRFIHGAKGASIASCRSPSSGLFLPKGQ
ncbi:hypothetical protein C8F04DRAFT_1248557 [Mycena alexandri]|uniref:Uncharacterized protein n=1 Tax=Mycena alexandri TaxID=1745969 RepID=A0AAD6THQ6_9AGAR|nr:hypothetical protein C8F04DRAFT_1248557 [Mycena alexandri]